MSLVVVIEDDPGSQKTLARVLRTGGYEAAIYGSAEDFLSSPPESPPIGLLLDVHLGGMSGLDLQRRGEVRQQPMLDALGRTRRMLIAVVVGAWRDEVLKTPDVLCRKRSGDERLATRAASWF